MRIDNAVKRLIGATLKHKRVPAHPQVRVADRRDMIRTSPRSSRESPPQAAVDGASSARDRSQSPCT